MTDIRFSRWFSVSGTLLTVLFVGAVGAWSAEPGVLVPGYQRFRGEGLSGAEAGRLLISELNCQSCHGVFPGEVLPPRSAPVLTHVGQRLSAEYLRRFLARPDAVKPGTAMPAFRELQEGETADDDLQALVHFLTADTAFRATNVSGEAAGRGEKLFHTVGCAACHGDQRMPPGQRPDATLPLGHVADKYSVSSLTDFLLDPLSVWPAGRMPSLNLTAAEAYDAASYLLREAKVDPNIRYQLYMGTWQELPDFIQETPVSEGECSDFSARVAAPGDHFALRFSGHLQIPETGEYQFWLTSDDGSRLIVDGTGVIECNGIHSAETKTQRIALSAGPHPLELQYFEAAGEELLTLEISGPGVSRRPAAGLVTLTAAPAGRRSPVSATDARLVERGRSLFSSLGCASCHAYGEAEQRIQPNRRAPDFASMKSVDGCLATAPVQRVPLFSLSELQRADLAAATASRGIDAGADPTSVERREVDVVRTLRLLNCFACHARGTAGGAPESLNGLFSGSIPEMGDEGRIPPRLDGVGDKLNPASLRQTIAEGTKIRPCMTTRMPRFGVQHATLLTEHLVTADQKSLVADVAFDEPTYRVKAAARLMVGDRALACIKCHSFDTWKATGIQAMDLTTMHQRLRRDWFHRYLADPQAYRPGTRMPSAWPNGRSVVPHVLDGSATSQIEAIWQYLEDGRSAGIPSGLQVQAIELKPVTHPLIYRNFLEGLSPRGIGVGYPERANLAYDAEQMTVRLVWHGAFIDASRHWEGRGPGSQGPLGDHVIALPAGPPLALLLTPDQPWPEVSARDMGFQFRGYRLDAERRPHFRYQWKRIATEDFLQPVAGSDHADASFERSLQFRAELNPSDLNLRAVYFRAAAGRTIARHEATWVIDEGLRMTFRGGSPAVRTSGEQMELLVPLEFSREGTADIVYTISW